MRRVMVVDDHGVLTGLIVRALEAEEWVERVAAADDSGAALVLAEEMRPDTIILDAQLPSGDGVDLVPRFRELVPDVRVIVLTARPRPDRERVALDAGAVGYLGKDGSLGILMDAVRSATAESPARDAGLIEQADRAARLRSISPREREVLALLADGKHVSEVSDSLRLSPYTTRDYVKSLLAKLGARSQLEAVTVAAREGLVRIG